MKKYFVLLICLIFFGGGFLLGCEESPPPPPPKPKIVRKKIGQIPPDILKKEPDAEASTSPQKNASQEEPKDTTEMLLASNSEDENKEALPPQAKEPLPAPPPIPEGQDDLIESADKTKEENADKTIDVQEKKSSKDNEEIATASETDSSVIKVEEDVKANEKKEVEGKQGGGNEQKQKGAEIKPSSSEEDAVAPLVLPDKEDNTLLAYNAAGKIDPFVPLFRNEPKRKKEEPKASKGKKPDKPVRRLTPLEKLDLDQLKLVGIVWAESGSKALVEETSGKGYIITKGTYIGIHSGRVVDIQKDKIVVEEKDEDEEGNQITHKRELKFQRPDGDEYYEM